MKARPALLAVLALSLAIAVGGCRDPHAKLEAQLREAARTNPPLEIVPGERVGPVRFGMTKAEVEKALGEPFRVTGQAYEYQMLGFAVLFDKSDRVSEILCGAWCEPSDILLDVFKGRTEDGLVLGTALDEALRILGPPIGRKEHEESGFKHFNYGHMLLAFRQDRLVHITLRNPEDPRSKPAEGSPEP